MHFEIDAFEPVYVGIAFQFVFLIWISSLKYSLNWMKEVDINIIAYGADYVEPAWKVHTLRFLNTYRTL